MKKIKEYIKKLIQENKERNKYEKENFKLLNQFETMVLKLLFCLLILILIVNGITHCKPPATLKAAEDVRAYYTEVTSENFTSQKSDNIYILKTNNSDILDTTITIKYKIYIKNIKASTQYAFLNIASNVNLNLQSVNRDILTVDVGITEEYEINNVYVFGQNNRPMNVITLANNSNPQYLEFNFTYRYNGETIYILDKFQFSTQSTFLNTNIANDFAQWNNNVNNQLNNYLTGSINAKITNAYNEGYNQALLDTNTDKTSLAALVRTIIDYPIRFFNTALDFNYKNFWVGNLFYILIFIGLGVIVIKLIK